MVADHFTASKVEHLEPQMVVSFVCLKQRGIRMWPKELSSKIGRYVKNADEQCKQFSSTFRPRVGTPGKNMTGGSES